MPFCFRPALLTLSLVVVPSLTQAADVTVDQILLYKPRRAGIEVETPTAADLPKCRIEAQRIGKASGWVLYGPQGQVLRRFLDTNADNDVDDFRYFQQGMEVYRELDTNANKKVDQYRWLGSLGTRWGIDSDEDGRIDRWIVLSAEEATLEAVRAMAAGDARALQALMVSPDDVKALRLSAKVGDRLLAAAPDVAGKLKATLAASKTIQPKTKWERFDCSMRFPSVLAAAPEKWEGDLSVYENAMALVANGTDTGFVQVGELVKVGDVWKLTRVPQPIDGANLQVEGGVLLQESLDAGSLTPGEGLSPEGQQLVEQLKILDDKAPGENAPQKEIETYNLARADLVQKLAKTVASPSEKELWWRQLIDGVAAETNRGMFPNGAERLGALETEVKEAGFEKLAPFVRFRKLLVDFAVKMQAADTPERQKVQEAHLQALRDFVQEYPRSEEAPEAMWQVATTIEFNGNLADAEKWYGALAKEYATTSAGERAQGALKRMGLKGKDLNLSGPALGGTGTVDVARFKGKVVAVVYWATWFKPSVDEMPQLVELYKTYQPQGFEIVGVNLDSPDTPVADFLRQQKATWPQIQDPDGMEGESSVSLGIISPGTMFLIGKDGKVVSNGASLDDLKKLVPDLVKK